MTETFLFLDDDAFHPEGIRNPEKYYPLIGRDDLLVKIQTFDTIVKFTNVEDAIDYILNMVARTSLALTTIFNVI